MPEFLKVKTAEEILEVIENIAPLSAQTVSVQEASGRVLSEEVKAPEPVPHFARSTMDGYAVRARDTFGAGESLPALLEVIGEVAMGQGAQVAVRPGTAVAIPTGGALPEGADAVVMVEYTQPLDETAIEVTRPVAPGDNVLGIGDDVAAGEKVLERGWKLRPQDVGLLAAMGMEEVRVFRRPRVAVVSTGDEIVPPETRSLPPGKIRDINTYVVAAQVAEAGGQVGTVRVVADDLDALEAVCREALAGHDVVILSGGSSVGIRDFTIRVLERFPGSELLAHGVAIRPGKPTILARLGEKVLWGLPGQPASAMIVFTAFVRPSLLRLQGVEGVQELETNVRRAELAQNIPSVHGRADYVRVRLTRHKGRLAAEPVFGKSAMISTLSKADGYVIVPEHVEGLEAGSLVHVHLFSTP
ncbi:molybdopterin molybdochelatase [Desulfacinum hydrothermale DSM 13146]|uniref:Molybdopterin molybdenumtransferase n=1 Tax=Desulfacinum hydrothermale DSM 13146 TaxID=1121390 RepID=A0A1W1XUS2_9BACT|nr:gephyrin-like molybdotransferase Glp [Desulfacinum hydrothermale]SMC27647.1 molybdopterin molybdochelatase [Desulfacinum hydrothermale DSM 13146]